MQNRSWDQLPGEPESAYRGFITYLEIGKGRNLQKAYLKSKDIPMTPEAPQAPGSWRNWSRNYQWTLRAEAYDRAIAQREAVFKLTGQAPEEIKLNPPEIRRRPPDPQTRVSNLSVGSPKLATMRDITEAETRKTLRVTDSRHNIDWESERLAARKYELFIAQRLLQKATEMLDVALIKRTIIPADPENGKPETHIFQPAKWSFKTAAEMVDIATKIRRLACELPITVKTDEGGGGAGDDAMFAATMGQLESALPGGVTPPMPDNPTERPDMTVVREVGEDGLINADRLRPA